MKFRKWRIREKPVCLHSYPRKKVIDSNPKVKEASYKTSLIDQVLNEHPASSVII